jgi:hypothetical protein
VAGYIKGGDYLASWATVSFSRNNRHSGIITVNVRWMESELCAPIGLKMWTDNVQDRHDIPTARSFYVLRAIHWNPRHCSRTTMKPQEAQTLRANLRTEWVPHPRPHSKRRDALFVAFTPRNSHLKPFWTFRISSSGDDTEKQKQNLWGGIRKSAFI